MANPNPVKARLAKALASRPGDLEETRRRIWGVLEVAYEDVGLAKTADARRRAVLAFVQIAATYTRTYEIGELEPRLAAMEKALKEQQAHGP